MVGTIGDAGCSAYNYCPNHGGSSVICQGNGLVSTAQRSAKIVGLSDVVE